MQLSMVDWLVVGLYAVVSLTIGLAFARRAGQGVQEFFLSGRQLPWWLLGTSMVATTFSTDTPNLVTDLVRSGGVRQNWAWWAFLLTGMMTVFFYAKLWRRSQVLTDMGFYELRYAGWRAAFLRGFRAIYLGVFFNVMIMASVTLAAIKISGVLLGVDKYTTVVVAAGITMVYAASSGLWGVVVTDFLQFAIAIFGAFTAAWPQHVAGSNYPLIMSATAVTGVVLGALYMLRFAQNFLFGVVKAPHLPLVDLDLREKLILAAIVAAVFALGLFPDEPMRKTEVAAQQYQQLVRTARLPGSPP